MIESGPIGADVHGGTASHRAVIVTRRTMLAESLDRLLRGAGHADIWLYPLSAAPDDVPARLVLLLDLDDPDILRLTAEARGRPTSENFPDRAVGFFDVFTPQHAHLAFELGVVCLVPLTASLQEIQDAIWERDRSTQVTSARGVTDLQLTRLATLTPREVEVLRVLASGLTTDSLARQLGISVRTVAAHKRSVLDKLEVAQLVQAVALALAAGIVPVMPAALDV